MGLLVVADHAPAQERGAAAPAPTAQFDLCITRSVENSATFCNKRNRLVYSRRIRPLAAERMAAYTWSLGRDA